MTYLLVNMSYHDHWSKDDSKIESTISGLKSLGVDLEKEGDASGYLGVKMEKDLKTGEIVMTQEGLTQRIIESLGLGADSTAKATPAEKAPLSKDEDGELAHGDFSYPSVIGQLLYLAGHTRPDITYAVHSAARFSWCTRRSHENALKRIGRYLKATSTKGLRLRPSSELKIDCYPDADFAGLWSHEDANDPVCVKSRTGFVITVADCPVLWQSKLQTEIALSTMEAEYVALSSSCKELFPIIDLVKELGTATNLPLPKNADMHISIHEDNSDTIVLAKLEPPRMTPRSKHYATKYHWFRERVCSPDSGIQVLKIDTKNQLGDIFTKSLGRTQFEYLRRILMGW